MKKIHLHRYLASSAILFALLIFWRYIPHSPLWKTISFSTAIYAKNGSLLRLTLAKDEQYRVWIPLNQIAPNFKKAMILYEDQWFYQHIGINPWALFRGIGTVLRRSHHQGGSTITMQLARRLYHLNTRTLWGKCKQIGLALYLESTYSKNAILEAYLNLISFSGNVEGIGAASRIYFHKPPQQLTLPESIALAVIPQNPKHRALLSITTPQNTLSTSHPPSFTSNQPIQKVRLRLWSIWLQHHPEDKKWFTDTSLSVQVESRQNLPFDAPHIVDQLLKEERVKSMQSEQLTSIPNPAIYTSIDLHLQHLMERIIERYLKNQSKWGIRNASALLIETTSMKVRAAVGSANYQEARIFGQVNGIQAKRSPGSTLKPFIYGLALDQGLLHPQTILKDTPTSFGFFSPENFDGRFVGPISAQDALIRSRNIPAVTVAAQLSKPDLYQFLKQANVSHLARPEHYGLSLVLGGGEVTMEELAQLYAMLANGGLWYPANYLEHNEISEEKRLLSNEAAFITLNMLQQNPRPDTSSPAEPPIAWKTGTSWGFKDAWTAGQFGRYVLVVWLGNFDGTHNPALIGIQAAAPLFFEVVDAIRAEHIEKQNIEKLDQARIISTRHTLNIAQIEVCTASGDLPDAYCTARTKTWFIPGKSPIRQSHLHIPVWIDSHTGEIYCHATPQSQPSLIENWSSDIQHIFNQAGLSRRKLINAKNCQPNIINSQQFSTLNDSEHDAPHIISPLRGLNYVMRTKTHEAINFKAEAGGSTSFLFWFVGSTWVGKTRPGERFFWNPPAPGKYSVRVVDDAGRAEVRELNVEWVP